MTEVGRCGSGAEFVHFAICARTRNVYNATLAAVRPYEAVVLAMSRR